MAEIVNVGGKAMGKIGFTQIAATAVRAEKDGKRVDDLELFGLTSDGRVFRYIWGERWVGLRMLVEVEQAAAQPPTDSGGAERRIVLED